MKYVKRLFEILGSFGLACIVLMMLMVLTFFGTIAQAHTSLEDVRTKYFDSLFFIGDYYIPLPGAYLLLSILAVNLFVGGFLRMRRTWSRVGIFIIHGGIAMLLTAGIVEFYASDKGYVQLYEGQKSARFQSEHEWEVAIAEELGNGRERVFLIPADDFRDLGLDDHARFQADGLPFTVELTGYLRNSRVRRSADGIDGYVLRPLEVDMEAQRNMPGIAARILAPGAAPVEALLWGLERGPFRFQHESRHFTIGLRKRSWELPFEVRLVKFTHTVHPGTNIPASYASDVVRRVGHVDEEIHISMNEPMRRGGYTFYQSGWGPQDGAPGARLFSIFSVVRNPADQWPLYSCVVIGLGLLIQFGLKLYRHVRTESRRRA